MCFIRSDDTSILPEVSFYSIGVIYELQECSLISDSFARFRFFLVRLFWAAVGYLHDYDYEKYPEEHLQHTEEPLREAGVPEEDIRAILSHGYSICNDVRPETNMEKSLFTVDELSGIIQAAARMRPNGIVDMDLKGFMKKWKNKKFAAKCNRPLILQGCEMLGMSIEDVSEICIEGMKKHAAELHLTPEALTD